jgi:tRNA-dihydrouridine synthase A
MMACTDRHARYLLRLISRHTLLYTEMVTSGAIIFGDQDRHLMFSAAEQPVAVQLGGNDPEAMAAAAETAQAYGYAEVNINVGCPSPRVKAGCFGAALMAQPHTVAACVSTMRERCAVPITVKTRIGVDDLDSYAHLHEFVSIVADAGCDTFIVHARKAWLEGLSPKQNREIPPLNYAVVHRLVEDFPQLHFTLNGGVLTLDEALHQLEHVHGVMIGRAAYHHPYILAAADERVFGDPKPALTRVEVIRAYVSYAAEQVERGVRLTQLTRPLLGLYHGEAGAKHWRRHISRHAHLRGAGASVIEDAQAALESAQLGARIAA